MAITAPTPITAAPPVPDSGQPEPTFDAQYEAFNTWERQQLVPGANALAQVTYQNALGAKAAKDTTDFAVQIAIEKASQADQSRSAAQAAAVSAAEQVTLAGNAAGQAEASRIEASKINLGAKSAAPTVDNQGQALRAGATYYDTTLNKWRVWSGSAWIDGVNVVAGVTSLNGESGPLVKFTLAGYGITNFKLETSGNADLNTLTTPGQYRFFSAAPNSPPGTLESVVTVERVSDTGSQRVVNYANGSFLIRGFLDQGGGTYLFTPWRRVLLKNEPAIAVSGTSINLALGSYFTDSVSANKTYSFANQVAGDSFIVEITHTGGAIAFSAVVWPGSTAPSLTTNRRHLFFFQLPSFANAWLGSYLGNYPL